jgi:Helix-turn-helix domain
MKTAKTQNQRLLAYLRKNRKGITTMEAFANLGICRLSERIRELEEAETGAVVSTGPTSWRAETYSITRTRELAANGATVTRYKLTR